MTAGAFSLIPGASKLVNRDELVRSRDIVSP